MSVGGQWAQAGGWLWPVCALPISAFVVWLSIRYARSRQLLDHPGQRRSHVIATPRGGGIGIVTAVFLCFCVAQFALTDAGSRSNIAVLAAALLAVAGVGWIDDHRGVSARIRFLVQTLASAALAVLFVGALPPAVFHQFPDMPMIKAIVFVIVVVALTWSINLHNFMDGSNGLLATQALFVFAVLAILSGPPSVSSLSEFAWVCAAAVGGFLPFNFPRAAVFMGDVGSGALGLLIAVAVLAQALDATITPFSGLIACSAFVVDATCTLISRFARGRRWYSAHREHLYQWLIRSGRSHAQVVAIYAGWNLLLIAPSVVLINNVSLPYRGLAVLVAVYAIAVTLWIFAKRACLNKVRMRQHAIA